MTLRQLKHRVAEYLAKSIGVLPEAVLARVVRDMAVTGKGTDACLEWKALPVPVHFYSPVPDIPDLEKQKTWDRRSELAGVDFRSEAQLELVKELGVAFGVECNWSHASTGDPEAYFTENGRFSFGCAASTHCLLRRFKPERVIEIGSGYSSLVISEALARNADVNGTRAEYVIVDPYPSSIIEGGTGSVTRLIKSRAELLNMTLFAELTDGDVLFIDSSHTVRIGGDVNFLFLDVLPKLSPGVLVHVHDISLPYEYGKEYFTSPKFRVFWTEAYLLQAFLCFNNEFEVLLAMNYLQKDHPEAFGAAFPHYDPQNHKAVSASFWMRRKGASRGGGEGAEGRGSSCPRNPRLESSS